MADEREEFPVEDGDAVVDGAGLADSDVSADLFYDMPVDPDNERLLEQMEQATVAEAERVAHVEAWRLPDRPADSASKDVWIDYCVALGASEVDLVEVTEHAITGRGTEAEITGTYVSPAYTKDELVLLANRLGG
jgi:hypothetical protein